MCALKARAKEAYRQRFCVPIFFQKKIQSYKQKLSQRTRENTARLNTSTLLYQEREELEQKLDGKQKSLVCWGFLYAQIECLKYSDHLNLFISLVWDATNINLKFVI